MSNTLTLSGFPFQWAESHSPFQSHKVYEQTREMRHLAKMDYCQNTNLTSPNGWVLRENDFTPPPPTETQCQQYLSCYGPDFNQTLKLGS